MHVEHCDERNLSASFKPNVIAKANQHKRRLRGRRTA
jgi:hypothetical protein